MGVHGNELQPDEYFRSKVIQVYEMMLVRHGFMIVGDAYGGKSSAWKCLQMLSTKLHEDYPDDSRWQKILSVVINPKSITMGQLYGEFDPVSHEWSDGVLAIKYRDCANSKIGAPEDRKWILFDGPVDAIWIENMNTVLDDNKKLCLQSGEMIALSDVTSMMFEPKDLEVASPATVSRCGVVYCEPHKVGWRCIVRSWCDRVTVHGDDATNLDDDGDGKNDRPFSLSGEQAELVLQLFDWLADPLLVFLQKECKHIAPCADQNLVTSCINILESELEEILVNADGHGESGKQGKQSLRKDKMDRLATKEEIECCILFSIVWSFGAVLDLEGRIKFNDFVRAILADKDKTYIEENFKAVHTGLQLRAWTPPEELYKFKTLIPEKGGRTLFEYCFSEGKWKLWLDTIPKFEIEKDAAFSSIVVSTQATAQFNYLMDLLFTHDKPTLAVGPTGTGKSTYVQQLLLRGLPKETYSAILTGFSANTEFNDDSVHCRWKA